MKKLLWKDFRLNRGLLLLSALGLTGVYLIGLIVEVSYSWPEMPTSKAWADGLCSYGNMALSGMSFIAALLGGNAIACERSDRSAYFLAYLPPTRKQILASKFFIATGALAIFWCVNCAAIYAIAPWLSAEATNFLYMLGTPWGAFTSCVLTLGIGWLGSAFLEKPTFPVLMALASPFVLGYGLFTFAAMLGISRFEVFEWAGLASFVIGVTAFAVGTRYYCLRVEP
jgi:ABC-type transport system involved in multi-copper enzyme maturation permease subunit